MSKRVKQEYNNPSSSTSSSDQQHLLPDGIRERISNLESRTVLLAPPNAKNKPVPKDIYERLKAIEDRVRYIEGISPEYLDILEIKREAAATEDISVNAAAQAAANAAAAASQLKVKREERSEDISKSLCGINSRIQELQASLKTAKKSD